MSQKEEILNYIKAYGSITPITALHEYECFRLAARISDLRQEGHNIVTHSETRNGATFARYTIEPRWGEAKQSDLF